MQANAISLSVAEVVRTKVQLMDPWHVDEVTMELYIMEDAVL